MHTVSPCQHVSFSRQPHNENANGSRCCQRTLLSAISVCTTESILVRSPFRSLRACRSPPHATIVSLVFDHTELWRWRRRIPGSRRSIDQASASSAVSPTAAEVDPVLRDRLPTHHHNRPLTWPGLNGLKIEPFDDSDGRQLRRTYPLKLQSFQVQHT
jgi:hypothetical protein